MTITWEKPGSASVSALEGDVVTVLSTIPSPPGSPLRGTMGPEPAVPITVKVRGCRATSDGRFTITGKLVSPTNELRGRLAEALKS